MTFVLLKSYRCGHSRGYVYLLGGRRCATLARSIRDLKARIGVDREHFDHAYPLTFQARGNPIPAVVTIDRTRRTETYRPEQRAVVVDGATAIVSVASTSNPNREPYEVKLALKGGHWRPRRCTCAAGKRGVPCVHRRAAQATMVDRAIKGRGIQLAAWRILKASGWTPERLTGEWRRSLNRWAQDRYQAALDFAGRHCPDLDPDEVIADVLFEGLTPLTRDQLAQAQA